MPEYPAGGKLEGKWGERVLDYLITNAQIADGSGGPLFRGDAAMADGKIAAVGSLAGLPAVHTLDAAGQVLAPGFIDLHRHADAALLRPDFGTAELAQGITTVIGGNCGMSVAPLTGGRGQETAQYLAPVLGELAPEERFSSLDAYFRRAAALQPPLNAGELAGMGVLRTGAAGFVPGPLTAPQLRQLHRGLERALGDGALGVSLGLGYAPECFYTTGELIGALAPLRDSGTVIAVHMRQEGDGVVDALREMLEVARALRTPVEISHLKAIGKRNWRRAVPEMLGLLASAREEGLDVSCDVYPYTAGSTQLLHVLPPEAQAGGAEALTALLHKPAEREKLRRRMETGRDFENITLLVGFENVRACGLRLPEDRALEGKSLTEIAAAEEKDPFEALFDLLERESCTPAMIDFIAAEADIAEILRAPFFCVISDATYPSAGLPHPRVYGMTAHLLAHFVRETGVLALPQAVAKLTRLPAERLGLAGKGRIAPGADADLVVFDPARVRETATYAAPRGLSEGMDWVFVNGVPAVAEGRRTGARAGRMLRR